MNDPKTSDSRPSASIAGRTRGLSRSVALLVGAMGVAFVGLAVSVAGNLVQFRPRGPLLIVDDPVRKLPPSRGNKASPKVAFHVSNGGTAPLHIERILSSCGCTVIDAPKTVLKPNESSVLRVAAVRPMAGGPSTVTVTIKSDSRIDPVKQLRITGFAERTPPFVANTSQRVFISGASASTDFWVETIEAPSSAPWLDDVSSSLPFARIERLAVKESSYKDGFVRRTYSLRAAVGQLEQSGTHPGLVLSSRAPDLKVPITVVVPSRYRLRPEALFASLPAEETAASFVFVVQATDGPLAGPIDVTADPSEYIVINAKSQTARDEQAFQVVVRPHSAHGTLVGNIQVAVANGSLAVRLPVVVCSR